MTTTAADNDGVADLLDVRNLYVSFTAPGGSVRAVNDVSFRLKPGSILGVVGESGSGKSVTARAIMRMLHSPGRVDSGSVFLAGEDILSKTDKEMRTLRGRDLAMVFQDPQAALNPVMRVGDQIVEALEVHGVKRKIARKQVMELLHTVGIPDVERAINLYPHEFSGGMRQRVVIAIALANKPRVLIADEPTTALDVTIQAQILELISSLRHNLGISIIMITHDMGVVAELCDEMVVMYGGRIVERGEVRDVFENPKHPYTNALLNAVPRIDRHDEKLLVIPGSPPNPANLPTGCSFHPRCPVAIERCSVELPPVTRFRGSQSAACWVSAQDGAVSLPNPKTRSVATHRFVKEGSPVLSIRDVRVNVGKAPSRFRKTGPVWAVDGVSLEVHAGETLGLVGESGCGKSTLARAIVGINTSTSGSIIVEGRDVSVTNSSNRMFVSSHIQYVFQDPYASLNPRRTIGQSLDEALAVGGVASNEARGKSVELLERVGLRAEHLDRYPFAFSGGQRQRVGIARALAAKPKMLICDEPVSALDVSIQAQIINLLAELRDDLGLAYLFIAHDLSVVRHLSDRVAVMYLGKIVEVGLASEVYSNPQHPYTAALLSSTPTPDVAKADGFNGRERIVLPGDIPSPVSPPSGCRFRTRCPIGPLFAEGRERCVSEAPALTPSNGGNLVACHFPGELDSTGGAPERDVV